MKFKDLIKIQDGKISIDWNLVDTIDDFKLLKSTPQTPEWHAEGDAYVHTVNVVNEMIKILETRKLTDNYEYALMMTAAALCHDLGKGPTTKVDASTGEIVTKRHGQASDRIVRTLFQNESLELREKVCYMCRWHMTMHHIFDKPERTDYALVKLSCGPVTVRDMIIMYTADSLGSVNSETPAYVASRAKMMEEAALKLGCLSSMYPFKSTWHRLEFFANHDAKGYLHPDDVKDILSDNVNPYTVYMMVGVPGSGKDYAINNMLPRNTVQVCRDLIRTEIGITGEKPMGTKSQEDDVTSIFNTRMDEYLKNATTFAINNTNVRKMYRTQFLQKILPHNPRIVYVYCEAPSLDESKKRRERMMPTKVIDRMWNDLDFPDKTEYSEIIYNVQRAQEDN